MLLSLLLSHTNTTSQSHYRQQTASCGTRAAALEDHGQDDSRFPLAKLLGPVLRDGKKGEERRREVARACRAHLAAQAAYGGERAHCELLDAMRIVL